MSLFARLSGLAVALCWATGMGAVGPPAGLAATEEGYARLPGYVDFESMGLFGEVETTIEVFLKGSLLALLTEAVKEDDPELAEGLAGLELVRIQVFPVDDARSETLRKKTQELAARLEKKGWEMVVRVREEQETIYVYLLPAKKENISGMVVMIIEDGKEATFVNIVGEINPAQLGKIGRKFNIDVLDVPFEVKDSVKSKGGR